ncbi:70-kilodalton heat shock protein, partial [Alternaria novae-zelandiae]|uniref:70-kilodalton heat shock protein n=1 Tax=Alternaria novae-zelandiae TaxID=430562 RepID=UPI0020C4C7A4
SCLSKKKIKRMLAKAKKYKAKNKAKAACISTKNALKFYAYSLYNTLSDSKVNKKLNASNKQKLTAKINKTV